MVKSRLDLANQLVEGYRINKSNPKVRMGNLVWEVDMKNLAEIVDAVDFIFVGPGCAATRKTLREVDGFSVIKYLHDGKQQPASSVVDEHIRDYAKYTKGCIKSLYLNVARNYKLSNIEAMMPTDDEDAPEIKFSSTMFKNTVLRVLSERKSDWIVNENSLTLRYETDNDVKYLKIVCTNDNVNDLLNNVSDTMMIEITYLEFNHQYKVCRSNSLSLSYDHFEEGHIQCNSSLYGDIFIGKKQRDCERYANDIGALKTVEVRNSISKDVQRVEFDLTHLYMIYRLLDIYLNDPRTTEEAMIEYEHHETEMIIFNRIFRNEPHLIADMIIEGHEAEDLTEGNRKSRLKYHEKFYIRSLIHDAEVNNPPRLEFSVKELRNIDKYCQEHGDFHVNSTTEYNLVPVLKDLKYGTRYLLGTCIYELHVDFSDNTMQVRVVHIPDENGVSDYFEVGFSNINKLIVADDVDYIRSGISVKENFTTLPRSRVEALRNVHEMCPKLSKHIVAATIFLQILKVIHDEPKRNQMIRQEQTVIRKPTGQQPKKNSSSNKQKEEVVVKRILMPTVKARAFVKEMNAKAERDGEKRQFNYVLESWDRVGHWRRKPHSEEQIWIEETTCTRHKPLTDKEIVIKM